MNEMISVIVPVYNVARYLSECIESIIFQNYIDLEIILIDDGSTDLSGKICDAYAKQDKRIHVIHQKNNGAASAKNTGLRLAKGQYLSFVDSDDILEPDVYSFMINQIKKFNADVIQCNFCNIYKNKKENQINFTEFKEYTPTEYLKLFTKDWTCGLLWDKLYKREIFQEIYFEEGHKIDDEFFTYQGIMNATKIIRVPKVIYNYRQRISGVMKSEASQEQIIMDILEYLSIRRKNVTTMYPELKEVYDEHYLNMLLILSKKSASTERTLYVIKGAIKKYNQEKEKIKIPLGLWKEIKILQYSSIKRVLNKKENIQELTDNETYFE